jgi:exodeoxyribonuclease VII large subunit
MTQIDLIASNISEMSVSELSTALKRNLEDNFGYVRIRGEISGYRGPHSSGHAYFSLKDSTARLDAVIWRTAYAKLSIKPIDGLEVVASGRISTFASKSSYQIIVEALEPAGVGALMALLENRRAQLSAEGLFDVSRKRKVPFMPRVIGVVTSPSGAVIRDILHRLSDRFPVHVVVWPVRVQGEGSAEEVTAAIRGFNTLSKSTLIARPDLIVVARGGGSLEDLWSFNDELLVRAVAASGIPVISAVGHETDWTLIDHAADLRAPTPTAAAEMAVPVRAELVSQVSQLEIRTIAALTRHIRQLSASLRATSRAVPSPHEAVAFKSQRLDALADRTRSLLGNRSSAGVLQLVRIDARLKRVSPQVSVASARETTKLLSSRLRFGVQRTHNALEARAVQVSKALSASAARSYERNAEQSQSISRQWQMKRGEWTRIPAALQRELGHLARSLTRAIEGGFERCRAASVKSGRLFDAVNYRSVLARGYALVFNEEDRVLTKVVELREAHKFTIRLRDGEVAASTQAPRRRQRRATIKAGFEQETLF